MFNRSKKVGQQFDWTLFIIVLVLSVIGFFCIRSATEIKGLGWGALRSQFVASVVGIFFIILFQYIDMDAFRKLSLPFYIITLLILGFTLAFGYGEVETGARSWVKLGPVAFQPSEFAKLGLIISLAALLERRKQSISKISTVLILLLAMGVPILMVLKQPDFGTAVVFIFISALMIFYAGIHWGYIVAAAAIVLIAAPIVYKNLEPYQQMRIINFLDPTNDPQGTNYQILQGIIAIGSGNLTGQGYMKGTQTRYGFIPEQDSDYIFSALVEQFGFIGGLLVIVLYFLLLYRILDIARNAKDEFERQLCLGISAMFFFHIFENIGMTIGLMPVTGIPLPFISNGGTFQLINMIAIGIVLSVSTQRRPLDFNAF